MNKIIEPNGGVTPTPSLLKTATEAQETERKNAVNWDHAPDWAQTYSVRNSFGNFTAKWWSAIGQTDAEAGATDQNKSQDAPVYFKLNEGEPLKLVHRPITTRDDLRAAAQERVGEVSDIERQQAANHIGDGAGTVRHWSDNANTAAREGENPMVGKVSGYRKLSQPELDLVNDIKAVGPLIERLIERARYTGPLQSTESLVAIAMATERFKEGAMWLIRGVAKPEGFF